MAVLNGIQALPIRNLKETSSPDISSITGERFAEDTLLRNMACSGCPVGCIHLGFVPGAVPGRLPLLLPPGVL